MNGTVIDYKNCIQFILGLNKNHLQFAKIQSLVEDDSETVPAFSSSALLV